MSIIVIIIMILVGMFGIGVAVEPDCQSTDDGCIETVTSTAWIPVDIDGVTGVIVAASDGQQFVASDEFWTPSTENLEAAEHAIAAAQGQLDHLRQYVGFVENGQQKIYVNGFTDAFGIDWMSQPVLVEDGGESFFQAVYNVDTDDLERFNFNGDA